MSFKLEKSHKIKVILAIAVILLGLVTIGLVFTAYGNPPQCEGIQHPDRGDNCIIGANIGAGLIFFSGLTVIWLGIVGLLASFAYRAHQLRNPTQKRLLIIVTAVLLIAPPIVTSIYTAKSVNEANNRAEQDAASFHADYRSDFVEYDTPPNWNEVSKESSTVAYSENASLSLYLNQCETGGSDVQYTNGRTYFVFSGVKDNTCVFYIHTQSAESGTWDSLLRTKCTWDINSGKDDTPIFVAGPNGIEFGDFLTKNCNLI